LYENLAHKTVNVCIYSLKGECQIKNVNLNYFATQSGRSRDPNLARNPLFADTWSSAWG